jgi:hypothetical protein
MVAEATAPRRENVPRHILFHYSRIPKAEIDGEKLPEIEKKISFGCYIPVTLFSKTKPRVGLLMIPKTCAYMWIIAMGLQLLF